MSNPVATPRSPVFVVGSPRSGTSALVSVLAAMGYNGYSEGNYLSLMETVSRVTEQHFAAFANRDPRIMIHHIDKQQLKEALHRVISEPVMKLNPVAPWFDKTGSPKMIRALPVVATIWPTSIFVYAKRRAIENIFSRVKKFPKLSFEYHCKDWAENMQAWREVRQQLPVDRCMEIDQREMISRPTDAAATLGGFLKVSVEQQVAAERVLRSNRPQETEPGSSERVRSLADSGWNEVQLEFFKKHCLPEMELAGYSLDETYSVAG